MNKAESPDVSLETTRSAFTLVFGLDTACLLLRPETEA